MTGIFIKALMKGASKVSPTIKSVKPKVGSLKTRRAGQDEVIKSADKAIQKNKLTKEQGVNVKKAIAPGLKKVSKTQDEIDKLRENKMGGGMMGRRFGMRIGSKPKTNVEKIKETFAPKSGLKKIDPKKQKGLAKLKKARPDVVRKMGYMKRGGRA